MFAMEFPATAMALATKLPDNVTACLAGTRAQTARALPLKPSVVNPTSAERTLTARQETYVRSQSVRVATG